MMKYKLLLILTLLLNSFYFSQDISKIEFHHSNSIILFKFVDIVFEPMKNNKKGKVSVKVKKDRSEEYFYRISKKKFSEISNAISKIKEKNYATLKDSIKTRCIDGSDIFVTIFQKNVKKQYYMDCVSIQDKNNENRKDFWYATKLIIKAARLEMDDLIDHR